MDKTEPTLVPQWLRSNGSLTGGGTTIHPLASSSPRSDDQAVSKIARKQSLVNNYDHNLGQSSVYDRTTSSYFRRSSSSNGSGNLRSSGSFSRSQRDRDWDDDIRESRKERSTLGGYNCYKQKDYSDSLGNMSLSRVEQEGLRRSHSMISDRRGETWPRKVGTDSSSAYKNNICNDCNPLNNKGMSHRVTFERDFPSLGADEKLAASEIGRIPSPGLSSAIHSLPLGTSAMMSCDKWTSALVEAPMPVESNGIGISLGKAATTPSFASVSSSASAGLNMAETVAQGPPRVQTSPQLSTETQRQELAIKQSRQLIPVTPSMPKVSNPPDKLKTKVGHSQLIHSPRGGPVKADLSKTSSIGKLQILKPGRERTVVSPAKDSLSPRSGSRVANPTLAAPLAAGPVTLRSPACNSGVLPTERKPILPLLDKRPSTQSAQSRNDFFKLVRLKSVTKCSSAPGVSPSALDKPGRAEGETSPVSHQSGDEMVLESENGVKNGNDFLKLVRLKSMTESSSAPGASASALNESGRVDGETSPVSHQTEDDMVSESINGVKTPNEGDVTSDGGLTCVNNGKNNSSNDSSNGKNNSSYDSNIFSEEEEAAFLRSLGWEENADEGGLTEEEINAFYRDVSKYINSKPSLKILPGMQSRFLMTLDSQIGSVAGISSGLNPSSSKLES